MRTRCPGLAALAALTLLACGGVAAAQTPPAPPLPAAQRRSLDRAILMWLANPVTGSRSSALSYRLTADGDHYRFEGDTAAGLAATGAQLQGGALSAEIRPLDGGRWRIDDARLASPITLSMPARSGRGAFQANIELQGQTGSGIIDPALATPSSFDSGASAMTGSLSMAPPGAGAQPPVATALRTGPIASRVVWQSAGPGRMDKNTLVAIDAPSLAVAAKQAIEITAAALHIEFRAKGIAVDQVQAAAGSGAVAAGTAAPPASPDALGSLRDAASSADGKGTVDELSISTGGHVIHLRQLAVTSSASAPGGRVDTRMRLVVQGLSSADIPPAIAAYVPRRLVLAPHLSGIPVDALADLLHALASRPKSDARQVQDRTAALLAKGPVSIGLDELAFDLGPALLSAAGSVTLAGPGPRDLTGNAVIEATGMSDLIQRAGTDPLLKRAQPLLIFLNGIGERQPSGKVVWKVVYGDGKMLVNGTDLSQLVPHG